jgi:hypothetical protein
VTEGIIDQRRPEQTEQQEAFELHPLDECPGNQRRGDDREHHLKCRKKPVRNRLAVEAVRQRPHSIQSHKMQPPDESFDVRAEAERIAVDHPLDTDQGHKNVTHGQGGKDVLATHHSPIEKRQRRGHEQDKRTANQYPCRVACVDLINHDILLS